MHLIPINLWILAQTDPGLGSLEALDPRQCWGGRRALQRLRGQRRGAALPGRGAAGAVPCLEERALSGLGDWT